MVNLNHPPDTSPKSDLRLEQKQSEAGDAEQRRHKILCMKPNPAQLVRLPGAPRPRVKAAAESSSPILTTDTISGTSRYSTIRNGFFPPKRIPRIFIASRMA